MLDEDTFKTVVESTPLVSIDLIVHDPGGNILLGLRKNRPALGWWFVPGGRVRKGESLDAAFRRISHTELGVKIERREARFLGVFEHFYDDSVFGIPPDHPTTHYVVLAYRVSLSGLSVHRLPMEQHGLYRWQPLSTIGNAIDVHAHTLNYFS